MYLRVPRIFLSSHPSASATATYNQPAEPLVYILAGSLEDVQRYSGTTVQWLITITRLIFCETAVDPVLYTPSGEHDPSWYDTERDATWRLVKEEDTLQATIYEVFHNSPLISARSNKPGRAPVRLRTNSPASRSFTSFRDDVASRDERCLMTITKTKGIPAAVHLLPTRLGHERTTDIYRMFAPKEYSQYGEASITSSHPSLGIFMAHSIQHFIDNTTLGFFCLDAVSHILYYAIR